MFRDRIHSIQERKPVEVRVFRVDGLDPVFSHQDGRVRIKDQIAGDVGNFGKDFSRDMAMPVCFRQNSQARGRKQGIQKLPGLR